MTTTPTPRTNALTSRMASELDRPILAADHFIELCDFARQLERENAALRAALQEWVGAIESGADLLEADTGAWTQEQWERAEDAVGKRIYAAQDAARALVEPQ